MNVFIQMFVANILGCIISIALIQYIIVAGEGCVCDWLSKFASLRRLHL